MEMSNATTTTTTQPIEKNVIEELLEVIDNVDLTILESAKQIEDISLRRDTIAQHFIDVAKNLGILKSVKSPSTMREKMYNVLATKTSDSKKMYLKYGATPDILNTCANVDAVIDSTKWKIKR
jgi:hypothetical protein